MATSAESDLIPCTDGGASGHGNGRGGACVGDTGPTVDWFKSTYSDNTGGDCVEGARLPGGGAMAVRDSKDPQGPALVFPAAAWKAFTGAVRDGEFPLV
ncbi:protein of unknown function [Actinacidiphila alni]|uniref:DUF397 domain-containing protein n=1 Tax=Actinacidiphila alni TaxID=380248 RepID=A0A1I2FA08_9ACTN|nr:DUF397 domain-containing protein [Actinacidiphila alni]SFF01360.1 protein of unknown function [Actinacidiphila alni]